MVLRRMACCHDVRRMLHQFRSVPSGPAARPGRPAGGARRPADRLRSRGPRAEIPLDPEPARRAVRVDHAVPRPGPGNDRAEPPAGERWSRHSIAIGPTPWASSAMSRPESMAAARWAATAGAAGDPDVREPGDRSAARLVERADQEAAGAPVRRSPGRRARAPRLPGRARDAARTESPWATTRSTTTISRTEADAWREHPDGRAGLPSAPYFLTVCRFVPEKNLVRLVGAFARYRRAESIRPRRGTWCSAATARRRRGRGRDRVRAAAAQAIHRPGFSRPTRLPRWYAHAAAFVLPSLSEPWGLVVNEAAASGLPLLVSTRAGCAATLVPEPEGTTGGRFDPLDLEAMTNQAGLDGRRSPDEIAGRWASAAEMVSHWGPDRFARGIWKPSSSLARHRPRRSHRSRWPSMKAR